MGKPSPGETKPRQFRLSDETLADLDLIAEFHGSEQGRKMSRADAVRLSARKEAARIGKAGRPQKK